MDRSGLTIVCFLWRDPEYRFAGRYTADHVNRLRGMVARNLATPHEFVCVTDDPKGLDERIRVVPLWPDLAELGNNWRRIKVFAPEMVDVLGERIVLMDVDCVVTGDLTPLFYTTEDFVAMPCHHKKTHYNTGFFYLRGGALPNIWRMFDPVVSPQACDDAGMIGWDQAWISLFLGPRHRTWGVDDGVLNYRYDVLKGGQDPEKARIVFFPGDHDPSLCEDEWVKRHWRS